MRGTEDSPIAGYSAPLKRTLRLRELLPELDVEKLLFPGGVICEVSSRPGAELASRVELLTDENSPEKVGVLRQLFVGYASHPILLDVARRSNYVVEVRTVDWERSHPAEGYMKDLLVVKRALKGTSSDSEGEVEAPSMWLERIGLSAGDKVIVSNPFQNFATPAPERG